mgnify:CR=1 FL=1
MEVWNEGKIRDFADVKGGKRLPKGKQLITEPNSHPYIRIRDLGKSKVLELNSDYEYVDDETQKSIARYIVDAGDILISVVGTIGLIAIVGESLDKANQTENCDKIINLKGISRDYLYYYLVSPAGQEEIKRGTVGAVQPKLPLKNVQDINIKYPSFETQEKIVSILNSIDDKISINEAINRNLQQQAQAIYLSMFITNADPDWIIGKLCDLITVKYGKDHKKLEDGLFPVYGSGGIMRYVERALYDKESVLIPRKGSLNNVMYVNEPFWSVDTMFYTEMKIPNIAKFIFHFIKDKDLASMNAGSAVPSMTTDILNSMEIKIPFAEKLDSFENVVAPIYDAIQANNCQSAKLGKLRDTLLPKLMTGELDVSDINI